jgi:hypothetical protein
MRRATGRQLWSVDFPIGLQGTRIHFLSAGKVVLPMWSLDLTLHYYVRSAGQMNGLV